LRKTPDGEECEMENDAVAMRREKESMLGVTSREGGASSLGCDVIRGKKKVFGAKLRRKEKGP